MLRRHPKMLKNRCEASPPQHSNAKALNRQRRWPIKIAECCDRELPAQSRRLPFVIGMHTPTYSVISRVNGLTDRQGMLSFLLPPIPCGLFKKNSRLPSAASAY
jgi:hypothetical protein